MDTNKLYEEIINNHSDDEVLEFCTNEIVKRYNLSTKQLSSKNYEATAGALGEMGFYLGLLFELKNKKTGDSKTVSVA